MKEYLIVDGYNIIGAWPELQKLKDIQLEEARDRLIDMMKEYQAFSGKTVIVVFDAHSVPGIGGKYQEGPLRVYYTKEKETADELIERLVSQLISRRTQIYVATSDMMEQHVIFGQGALRLPARELLTKWKTSQQELKNRLDESIALRRNPLVGKISDEQYRQLERWRRGK